MSKKKMNVDLGSCYKKPTAPVNSQQLQSQTVWYKSKSEENDLTNNNTDSKHQENVFTESILPPRLLRQRTNVEKETSKQTASISFQMSGSDSDAVRLTNSKSIEKILGNSQDALSKGDEQNVDPLDAVVKVGEADISFDSGDEQYWEDAEEEENYHLGTEIPLPSTYRPPAVNRSSGRRASDAYRGERRLSKKASVHRRKSSIKKLSRCNSKKVCEEKNGIAVVDQIATECPEGNSYYRHSEMSHPVILPSNSLDDDDHEEITLDTVIPTHDAVSSRFSMKPTPSELPPVPPTPILQPPQSSVLNVLLRPTSGVTKSVTSLTVTIPSSDADNTAPPLSPRRPSQPNVTVALRKPPPVAICDTVSIQSLALSGYDHLALAKSPLQRSVFNSPSYSQEAENSKSGTNVAGSLTGLTNDRIEILRLKSSNSSSLGDLSSTSSDSRFGSVASSKSTGSSTFEGLTGLGLFTPNRSESSLIFNYSSSDPRNNRSQRFRHNYSESTVGQLDASSSLHQKPSIWSISGASDGDEQQQLLETVVPAEPEAHISGADDSDADNVYQSHSSLYNDDDPLYQIYHQGAVVRDVVEQDAGADLECHYGSQTEYMAHVKSRVTDILQRGTLVRSGSVDPGDQSNTMLKDLSTLEAAARCDASFKKLWCEMPQVITAGILSHMNMDERKLQESMFEIICSEASYLKSLNILVGHFMKNLGQNLHKAGTESILSHQDFLVLFSNSRAVRKASIRTLEVLERLWSSGCVLNPVKMCAELADVVRNYYSVYVTYCSNAIYQDRKFRELLEKNMEFVYAVRRLETMTDCRSLPLSSFLLLPMQRITRLPLLVNAVCHRMKPDDAASAEVTGCISVLQKTVKQCNDGAKKMSNLEQMMEIVKMLDLRSTKGLAVVAPLRYLVKKGPLIHIMKQTTGFLRRNKRALMFFLFNDLLIITKKKNDKQYEVIEHSPRLNVLAQAIPEEDIQRWLPNGAPIGCRNLFYMALMDERLEFILSCESLNDQMRWIQAFTPPEPAEGELHESWDCPQVQAVQKYIAKEPDELSLEESDIINVLRKVKDGWYEGERIRDGEKGWFPVDHTIEIENQHVRARNLRQQYRLLTKTFDAVGHSSA